MNNRENNVDLSTLSAMPDEIIIKIIDYLPLRDLISLSQVDRKFNTIFYDIYKKETNIFPPLLRDIVYFAREKDFAGLVDRLLTKIGLANSTSSEVKNYLAANFKALLDISPADINKKLGDTHQCYALLLLTSLHVNIIQNNKGPDAAEITKISNKLMEKLYLDVLSHRKYCSGTNVFIYNEIISKIQDQQRLDIQSTEQLSAFYLINSFPSCKEIVDLLCYEQQLYKRMENDQDHLSYAGKLFNAPTCEEKFRSLLILKNVAICKPAAPDTLTPRMKKVLSEGTAKNICANFLKRIETNTQNLTINNNP